MNITSGGAKQETIQVTAYIMALYQEYVVEDEYILQEYRQPRDGSYYTADIQETK